MKTQIKTLLAVCASALSMGTATATASEGWMWMGYYPYAWSEERQDWLFLFDTHVTAWSFAQPGMTYIGDEFYIEDFRAWQGLVLKAPHPIQGHGATLHIARTGPLGMYDLLTLTVQLQDAPEETETQQGFGRMVMDDINKTASLALYIGGGEVFSVSLDYRSASEGRYSMAGMSFRTTTDITLLDSFLNPHHGQFYVAQGIQE